MNATVVEARAWLKAAQANGRFRSNRFSGVEEALDFVYKLYRGGALNVWIDASLNGASSALVVELPGDHDYRARLLEIVNSEASRRGSRLAREQGQATLEIPWE
jgi:hypothetical protein